jgi:peptidoglycan biosynthesis protein MviN/MurJ (putative lipid II flippase)
MVGLALSQGRPGGPIVAVIGSAAAMIGVGIALVPPLDAAGVGLAASAGAALNAAMLAAHTEREMRSAVAPVAQALAIGLVAAAAGYLAPLPETALGLVERIAISAAAWTALGVWSMRPVLRDALRVARPMLPPRLRWSATSGP